MTFMNQLSIIPAVLVTVACVLVIRNVVTENARRRLLLFVLGLGVLLNGARYVTMRYITEPYNQPFFNLSTLLAPSLLGLMALALVNVKAISGMRRGARIMAILLILMMVG